LKTAMHATDMRLLRALAARGAMQRRVRVTSSDISKELGISQQAVSTALIRLEKRGFAERAMAARGQHVKLTKAGVAVLKSDYLAYKRIFESEGSVGLSGTVVGGLGEGAYYLAREGYERGLSRILGAPPYGGTLNVKVEGVNLEALDSLRGAPGQVIPGFEEGGRTFGPIKCFKARIDELAAVVVVPSRTHYTDTLEIVAGVRLREALNLENGSPVKVTVELS
jgi:riboflavin kinase